MWQPSSRLSSYVLQRPGTTRDCKRAKAACRELPRTIKAVLVVSQHTTVEVMLLLAAWWDHSIVLSGAVWCCLVLSGAT